MDANKRNSKIKIAKIFIEYGFSAEKTFSRNDISSLLFLRDREFEAFNEILFVKTNRTYRVSPAFYVEITEWKRLHKENSDSIQDIIIEYKRLFESIEKTYKYSEIFDQFTPLLKKLHWHFLPVYQDVMIDNRGCNPEDNIEDYYDHYHSLQDLYRIVSLSPNYWKTLKGDINLNQECNFPVYTNRWGHEDTYKVTRTYNGWYVKNIVIEGFSSPNGRGLNEGYDGGFIANFNQDYVDYPDKFHSVIERLWNLADESDMNIQELQDKLTEVAKLISEVEKTVARCTPDWY